MVQCWCYFKSLGDLSFTLLVPSSREVKALNPKRQPWKGTARDSSWPSIWPCWYSPSGTCLLWAAVELPWVKSILLCCYNQHSHGGDGAWWFIPLLKMRHPCWKFWEILQLLGVWIQRWQHYLLHQEKTKTNGTPVRPQKQVYAGRCGTPCSHLCHVDFMCLPFCAGDGHQTVQHCWGWSPSRHVPGFSEIALKTQVLMERLIEKDEMGQEDLHSWTQELCLNSLSCLCILCDCAPTRSRAYCCKTLTKWEKRSFCHTEKGQRTQRTKEEDKDLAWGDVYMRRTPVKKATSCTSGTWISERTPAWVKRMY